MLADVTPVYEKKNPDFLDNYRIFSVLPGVSKIVERAIKNQICCVYLKGSRSQYALLSFPEMFKMSLDMKEHVSAVLMDLSKAFDTTSN